VSGPVETGLDATVHQAVSEELAWIPEVDGSAIRLTVHGGAVTLTGEVGSFGQRRAAVKAALRVHGVTAVADKLTVRYRYPIPDDEHIAQAVAHALDWITADPECDLKADVRDHVVTLTGTVAWHYQRDSARRSVENLQGVEQVVDHMALRERPSAADTAENIRRALIRNAAVNADQVQVTVHGNEVTLTGTVASWVEKKQAGLAAWSSPHVTAVHNNLHVGPVHPGHRLAYLD
jgi:osmotically-inducible protein OsmY